MLAQNFLTHTDLEISDKEHGALVRLLGMLERNELPLIPALEYEAGNFQGDGFNMSGYRANSEQGCGTAGCIAGWVSILLDGTYYDACQFAGKTNEIDNLCHVTEESGDAFGLEDITTAQAASALRSYLTTGKANWAEALK